MARDPGDAVYIISVAAELAGVHPQTLRIYERRGLISPQRTPGGTRRYSEEDLEQLGMIQELTADGVNLEGVRRIMEMRTQIERLQKQVNRLRRLLGEAEQRYQSGTVTRVGYATTRRRHLPDVNRPDLGGMVDR
jgi:MerR family transcriptional regulator/heat shock protein HspR